MLDPALSTFGGSLLADHPRLTLMYVIPCCRVVENRPGAVQQLPSGHNQGSFLGWEGPRLQPRKGRLLPLCASDTHSCHVSKDNS